MMAKMMAKTDTNKKHLWQPDASAKVRLTASDLTEPGWGAGLRWLAKDQPLLIKDVGSSNTTGKVVLTGKADILSCTDVVVTLSPSDADGDSGGTVRFDLPESGGSDGKWQFGRNLPELLPFFALAPKTSDAAKGDGDQDETSEPTADAQSKHTLDRLPVRDLALVLTTIDKGKDTRTGARLCAGLNLVGRIAPAGLLGPLQKLVTVDISVPLAGQIIPTDGDGQARRRRPFDMPWRPRPLPPGLHLLADLGIDTPLTEKLRLHDVALRLYCPLGTAWAKNNPTHTPSLSLSARLDLTRPPAAPLRIELAAIGLGGTGGFTLISVGKGATLSAITDIIGVAGDVQDLLKSLPEPVSTALNAAAGAIELRQLALNLNADLKLSAVNIGLAIPKLKWTPLDGVTLRSIAVDLTVNDPFGPGRQVEVALDASLRLGNHNVAVRVDLPGLVLSVTAGSDELIPLHSVIEGIGRAVGATLSLPRIDLQDLSLLVSAADRAMEMRARAIVRPLAGGLSRPWMDRLDLSIMLAYTQKAGISGQIEGRLMLPGIGILVTLAAGRDTKFKIRSTDPEGEAPANLGALVALFPETGLGAQSAFGDLTIKTLEASYDFTAGTFSGHLHVTGNADATLKSLLSAFGVGDLPAAIAGTALKELGIKVKRYKKTPSKPEFVWSFVVDAKVKIGDMTFDLKVDIDGSRRLVAASVVGKVQLGAFLKTLDVRDQPGKPGDLALTDAGFRYQSEEGKSDFQVFAGWGTSGRLALSLTKPEATAPKRIPAIWLRPGSFAGVSDAELSWSRRKQDVTFAFSQPEEEKTIKFIDGVAGKADIALRPRAAAAPLKFRLALDEKGFALNRLDDKGKATGLLQAPVGKAPAAAEAKPEPSDKAADQVPNPADKGAGKGDSKPMLTLDKSLSLGLLIDALPLSDKVKSAPWMKAIANSVVIDQAGVDVSMKPLSVTLSGDLTINAGTMLSVSAKGLRVAIIPSSLSFDGLRRPDKVSFDLDGGALALSIPPIFSLAVAAARNRDAVGKDFAMLAIGRLELLKKLEIIALVSVILHQRRIEEAFVFLAAKGLSLGTAGLRVTAIGGGFGYNVILKLPERPQDVADFPIIQLLGGPAKPAKAGDNPTQQLQKQLTRFKSSLRSEPGAWCIAVGITARIAELVDCVVLAVVEVRPGGVDVAVIGLADLPLRLSGPAKGGDTTKVPALGHIQLAVSGRFSSAEGTLRILGALTDKSWLLSEECRLSGGFAICLWLKGPNKGDFLVSLGGYSPLVKAKSHYPALERIAFSWPQPKKSLSLSGGVYLALDRYGIQFGMAARLHYESTSLTVRAAYQLDALIQWTPMLFRAELRMSCAIEVRSVITTSLSLDVEMQAWGAPFGGRVKVSVDFLFTSLSYTVEVGAARQDDKPVPLTDVLALAGGGQGDPIRIATSGGSGEVATLRADQARLDIGLAVPATGILVSGNALNAGPTPDRLDIRPMRRRDVKAPVNLAVSMEGNAAPLDLTDWRIEPRSDTPTEALWYEPDETEPGKRQAALQSKSGRRAVVGVTVQPPDGRLMGATQVSIPAQTSHTSQLPRPKPEAADRNMDASMLPADLFDLQGCSWVTADSQGA